MSNDRTRIRLVIECCNAATLAGRSCDRVVRARAIDAYEALAAYDRQHGKRVRANRGG